MPMRQFQIIDPKKKCAEVYLDGEIVEGVPLVRDDEKLGTWYYSQILRGRKDIEYAKIYCNGSSIEAVCPHNLKTKWQILQSKMNSFHNSFKNAKLDMSSVCIFDLVPERIIKSLCETKSQISKVVLEQYKRPQIYEHAVGIIEMLDDISHKYINYDGPGPKRCVYDFFGSKTGRLTNKADSFPILTLAKKDRVLLKPNNDCFVSLDFKSAEVRMLNCLLGKNIEEKDLHDWNVKNIFNNKVDRETAKKDFFSWLYNPNYKSKKMEGAYNREEVSQRYFDNGRIRNDYGREIESDQYHALNYIVQSSLTDLFLEQSKKIHKFLEGRKTYVAFLIHDNLVLDVKAEEKELLKKCVDTFCKTRYGYFWVSTKIGKNLLEMKEI